MGGHGGSSGFNNSKGLPSNVDVSEAKAAVKDTMKAYMDGDVTSEQYGQMMKVLADHYGVNVPTLVEIGAGNYDQPSSGATVSQLDVSSLAGQNGNPWPPDAGKNHLAYDGGGGLGVWNQFGGGVKNGGVSSAKAKELYSAVDDFTGDYYHEIRAAMKKGDFTSKWGKQGALCEEFITAGINSGNGWNGGTTYRGIGGLSNTALKAIHNLKAGDEVDCNWGGIASWSTRRSKSEGFGSGYNHVTFVHLGSSQKGVSVANIAHYGTMEQEVLVSSTAKYKVAAVVAGQVGTYSQTYVYVEDA